MLINNLSLRTKIIAPMIFLALIFLGVAILSINNLSSLTNSSNKIVNQYMPAIEHLLRIDSDLYSIQSAERSLIFLKVGDEQYNLMARQQTEKLQDIERLIEALLSELTGNTEKQLLSQFRESLETWKQTTLAIERERREGGRIGRRTAIDFSFGIGYEQFQGVQETLTKLIDTVNQNAKDEKQLINGLSESSKASQIVSSIIGLALVITVAIYLPYSVLKPLNQLMSRVNAIAHGDGDLTARLKIDNQDEFGKLATAFNSFLNKLQKIIGSVAGSIDQIASQAEELSVITNITNESITKQNSNIEEVANAIQKMSTSVNAVSQSTSEAANSASAANERSLSGRQIVQETIQSIEELAGGVNESAGVVRLLLEDSDNIGGVLDVIKSIAEQTNLLALNAAIEAARAGEQGRGFAVVADEVRSLAGRTQESTQEIQNIIERLQQGTQNSVHVMEQGQFKVQQSVEKASLAGEALEAITRSVNTINTMSSQVVMAIEEQNTMTNNINENLHQITNSTSQSSQNIGEVQASGEELARLAASLQEQIGLFKT